MFCEIIKAAIIIGPRQGIIKVVECFRPYLAATKAELAWVHRLLVLLDTQASKFSFEQPIVCQARRRSRVLPP